MTRGQVAICANVSYACDASLAFAVLPLSASGTASARFYGLGNQYFQAGYLGTAAYAAGNSGINYTTVTFANSSIPTTLTTTATPTRTAGTPAGNTQNIYSLTAALSYTSVATTSPNRPTVASNFYDTSNGHHLLGSPTGVPLRTEGYVAGATLTAGTNPVTIASGDFNNDGHADLAIVNTGDGTVSILLGKGDGTFQTAVPYSVGTAPGAVVAGDFNLDGNLDLAVVNNTGKTISILLGNGNGTFAAQATYATGNNPIGLGMGDLNGDGYSDLVVLTVECPIFCAVG